MSISAPQLCRNRRNGGAEIDILATSTSFRHLFDKSFLTWASMTRRNKNPAIQENTNRFMNALFIDPTPSPSQPHSLDWAHRRSPHIGKGHDREIESVKVHGGPCQPVVLPLLGEQEQ